MTNGWIPYSGDFQIYMFRWILDRMHVIGFMHSGMSSNLIGFFTFDILFRRKPKNPI